MQRVSLLILVLILTPVIRCQSWIQNPSNGHYYTLTTVDMTWEDAEALAVSLEGHLATVRNQAEQQWLWKTFGSANLLVGFTDKVKEGTWVWASGETSTFTNWSNGEPNNSGGNKHYSRIEPYTGLWNDVSAGTKSKAIIEISSSTGKWIKRTPKNNPPARYYTRMAYDSIRKRVVLFGGGLGRTSSLGDTWEWDGADWTQMKPPKPVPAARQLHALAFDAKRGRVVMFGGGQSGTLRNDTWEWDGKAWTNVTPKTTTNPSARVGHGLTYDSGRQKVVLFGGDIGSGKQLNDTWEWDGKAWVDITPKSGNPPVRGDLPLTYDAKANRVFVFGGWNGSILSDTWQFDGKLWSELKPSRTPGKRRNHAMAFDAQRGRVVLFGGYDGSNRLSETWEWDGGSWVPRVPTSSPDARSGSGMTFDSERRRMVLFGGSDGSTKILGDTWEYVIIAGDYTTFGSGCAGSATPPSLQSSSPPRIGTTFTLNVTNLRPPTLGVLVLGVSDKTWNGATLPLDLTFLGMKGCNLLVSWDAESVIALRTGTTWTWKASIPNNALFIGTTFFNQAWTLDSKANSLGISTSNGGKGVVGF
jgi:hypothetical protein